MTLQDIIAAQGRKQSWIADKLGIPHGSFSQIVRGRQRMPTDKIEPMAQLLGVPVIDVLRAVAQRTEA